MKKSYLSKISSLLIVSASGVLMLACGGSSSTKAPTATGSVAKTPNPLVAQYSLTAGCDGSALVNFGPDTSYGRSTNWVQVSANQKKDLLVAGMRASTTYHMQAQTICFGSNQLAVTPDTTFKTGPLPSTPFPQMTVSRPNSSSASAENPGIELVNIFAPGAPLVQTYVTDRDGNPIWYYDVGVPNYVFTIKPLPNGNIILTAETPTASILREIDVAGNTIKELDIPALAAKSLAAGFDFSPTFYHHDICPLPNGHIIVLVENEGLH
jgi:hypothetical protein